MRTSTPHRRASLASIRKKQPASRLQQQASQGRASQYGPNSASTRCQWCGGERSHEHNREECPARGRTCNKCGRRGHFATVCRSSSSTSTRSRGRRSAGSVESAQLSESPFMGSVHEVQTASDSSPTAEDAWSVQLFICDTLLDFKIDTGADVSCITYTTYLNLCACPALEQSHSTLTGPSGDALAVKLRSVRSTHYVPG